MFLNTLTEFFGKCPAFSKSPVYQNYLSPKIPSVSIHSVPENPIFRVYVDGGAVYQTVFRLVIRVPFDKDFDFSTLYSSFFSWMQSLNTPSLLPKLGNGFSPISLSVIKSGELTASSPSFGEYEILCRLLYS